MSGASCSHARSRAVAAAAALGAAATDIEQGPSASLLGLRAPSLRVLQRSREAQSSRAAVISRVRACTRHRAASDQQRHPPRSRCLLSFGCAKRLETERPRSTSRASDAGNPPVLFASSSVSQMPGPTILTLASRHTCDTHRPSNPSRVPRAYANLGSSRLRVTRTGSSCCRCLVCSIMMPTGRGGRPAGGIRAPAAIPTHIATSRAHPSVRSTTSLCDNLPEHELSATARTSFYSATDDARHVDPEAEPPPAERLVTVPSAVPSNQAKVPALSAVAT